MSGGKGGKSTSKVEIPKWLEDPAKRAISRGEDIAQIGYMPYMGPDVAAFSPTQMAAFGNTNQAASAFGMTPSAGTGMPPPTNYGGVQAYSSYPIYEQSVDAWRTANPQQAAQYDALFGNVAPAAEAGAGAPTGAQAVDPFSPAGLFVRLYQQKDDGGHFNVGHAQHQDTGYFLDDPKYDTKDAKWGLF